MSSSLPREVELAQAAFSQQARFRLVLDSLTRVRLILLLLTLLAGLGLAQEQHNFLALDNELLDASIGPYYFIEEGNSTDAYARADPLARALGAEVSFDTLTMTLTFRREDTTVRLQATDNIVLGLQKRVGALSVDGQSRVSPSGILVEGSSYVAVGPIVEALGGDSDWDPESRVLFIDSPLALAERSAPAGSSGTSSRTASSPRYAFHETKSRVALNIPAGSSYRVLVEGNRFVVAFAGLSARAFQQRVNDPFLQDIAFAQLDGDLALTVSTRYPLVSGSGYQVGLLPESAEHPGEAILYVDFAPDLQGETAEALGSAATVQSAADVQTPHSRKVVVIDAGHGGHDPGTLSSYAVEKQVVLAIADKLAALLEAKGIEVVLTRDSDFFLTLAERATFAKPEINLFVSIHANAAANSSAHGIETWVFGEPLDEGNLAQAIRENGGGAEGEARTQEALEVANSVTGNLMRAGQLSYSLTLAEMVQHEMIQATGAVDRSVKQSPFYVIKNARSPAILVEVGFVSNPDEGSRLATDAYQTLLAEALAQGILDFFSQGSSLANR